MDAHGGNRAISGLLVPCIRFFARFSRGGGFPCDNRCQVWRSPWQRRKHALILVAGGTVTKALILIAALLASNAALAEAPSGPKKGLNKNWASLWDDCYDLNLPYFQARIEKFTEFLKAGDAWELAIETEKVKITHFNKETCKGYGLVKNDGKGIAEMTMEMAKTAQPANDLYARGENDVGKQLQAWMTVAQKELDEYKFPLGEFPCGKALDRTKKLIIVRMQEIEAKAKTIAVECPASMEAAAKDPDAPRGPKAGVKQTYGQGAGTKMPTGTHDQTQSDISGVKEAIEDEKKSEEKLRQQDEEARKRKSKKGQ